MHGWKVEYLYRTALSKGWIRHAEHVQRKRVFTERPTKPLTLYFSKTSVESGWTISEIANIKIRLYDQLLF